MTAVGLLDKFLGAVFAASDKSRLKFYYFMKIFTTKNGLFIRNRLKGCVNGKWSWEMKHDEWIKAYVLGISTGIFLCAVIIAVATLLLKWQ